MMRSGLTVATVVLAFVVTGCGETKNPVVKVEGKAVFSDGTPLPAGSKVLFNPTEGGTGTASGVVESDGTFKVKHVSGRTGAEVGSYTVSLLAPDGQEAEFFGSIAKEYAEGQVLTAIVKEGMEPLEFKITRSKNSKKR